MNDQIHLKDLVFALKSDVQEYLLHESPTSEKRVRLDIKKIATHIDNTSGTLEEDIKMPQNLDHLKKAFEKYVKLVRLAKTNIEQNRLEINKAKEASQKLREAALQTLFKHPDIDSLTVLKDQIELLDYVTAIKIKEKNYLLYKKQSDYQALLALLHQLQTHIENTPGTLEEDAGIPRYLKRYEKGLITLHAIFEKENQTQHAIFKESDALV